MGKRKHTEDSEEIELESTSSRKHHKKHKHKSKKHKKRHHEGRQSDPSNSESIEVEDDSQNVLISYDNENTVEEQSFVIEEQIELSDLGMLEDIGEHMVIESYDLPLDDLEVDVEGQEIELDMINVEDQEVHPDLNDVGEDEEEEEEIDVEDTVPKKPSEETKRSRKTKEKEESDDERWLDALESGKVEMDEEIKRMKDPKLMTARQRAMLERIGDGGRSAGEADDSHLLSLPTGYKEVQVTEELIKKRALKSQLRRQQAEEKREKDKKRTMDRLLLKKESKTRGAFKHGKKVETAATSTNGATAARIENPMLSLVYNQDGSRLNLPPGTSYPLIPSTPVAPPPPRFCEITGCGKPRKYSSKTGVSLCSLDCYRTFNSSVRVQ